MSETAPTGDANLFPEQNPSELSNPELDSPSNPAVELSPPDPASAVDVDGLIPLTADNDSEFAPYPYLATGQYPASQHVPPTFSGKKRGKAMVATLVVGSIIVAGTAGFGGAALYNNLYPQAGGTKDVSSNITINNPDNINLISAVAAKASPSVVTLEVAAGRSAGTGSGVILSEDGYVLTNNHVVTFDGEKAKPEIIVKAANGKLYTAKLIATDPIMDLAVIKLDKASGLQPIEFADSSLLNVGDTAIAIGAPLGLEGTVTEGIISALNRSINVSAPKTPSKDAPDSEPDGSQFWNNVPRLNQGGTEQPLSLPVIQTDAAINPGNSGGALLNSQGQLIGINVAIATASGNQGAAGSIGVGFAIPSNLAKRVADELIEFQKASHGLLGASVRTALTNDSQDAVAGAYIAEVVPGSAAAAAGLKAGDVITQFNNVLIGTSSDLTAQVRYMAGGSQAELTYSRGGQSHTTDVTLGQLDQ